jgi:hypothetical protein
MRKNTGFKFMMREYVIIDKNQTKLSTLGIVVFPPDSILGTVKAYTSAKAIAIAQQKTELKDLKAIATGSPSLFKSDLQTALTKSLLGSQQPTDNLRNAGRKSFNKKVVRVELRLSDGAYDLLQSQPNKAGFVADLIEERSSIP